MPGLFIGCSGFSYPHWRGSFYPTDLPLKRWFEHYCASFRSIELNVTFYRLQKPETFSQWRQASPDGFTFAVKGSRFITHIKRLADPESALANFFDGALLLGDKLRVVLWQLPPGFARSLSRLERFLALLERYPVRHALEFRHESWCCEEVFTLCHDRRIAVCMADWPVFSAGIPRTTDFVYFRRHGQGGSYSGCYSPAELAADAATIRGFLDRGNDVYLYFNNDAGGYAPANAAEIERLLG